MVEDYEELCSELSKLAKQLNVSFVIENKPTFSSKKYMIRFTIPRRWGGVKKYAYESTLKTIVADIAKIQTAGGKIIAVD